MRINVDSEKANLCLHAKKMQPLIFELETKKKICVLIPDTSTQNSNIFLHWAEVNHHHAKELIKLQQEL